MTDSVHDLIGVEAWRDSLARSRARRGKPMPTAAELSRWAAGRPSGRELEPDPAAGKRALRRALARPLMLIARPGGVVAAAAVAALLASVSHGAADSPRLRAPVHHAARAIPSRPPSSAHRVLGPGACQRVDRADGYVNPVAGAALTPKRVDQGVDYTGTGVLTALGAGTVTVVATSETGWPGAFLEYRLLDGPAAGCYVFYAEGIVPAANLHVGETVRPGQPVAKLIPGYAAGIEIGWGAGKGTETYAAKLGEWSTEADEDNVATAAGKSFSRLIQSLGGPPGKIEG